MTHGNQHLTRYVVDWPVLLEELRLSGLTFRQLAAQVDCCHATLINYSQETTSPTHAIGERLIERWQEVTCKPRSALPLTVLVKRLTALSA